MFLLNLLKGGQKIRLIFVTTLIYVWRVFAIKSISSCILLSCEVLIYILGCSRIEVANTGPWSYFSVACGITILVTNIFLEPVQYSLTPDQRKVGCILIFQFLWLQDQNLKTRNNLLSYTFENILKKNICVSKIYFSRGMWWRGDWD